MPSVNVDVQQPSANIDGITMAESMPSGFISAGVASSASALGVATEEMDERQLTTQVCFSLVG